MTFVSRITVKYSCRGGRSGAALLHWRQAMIRQLPGGALSAGCCQQSGPRFPPSVVVRLFRAEVRRGAPQVYPRLDRQVIGGDARQRRRMHLDRADEVVRVAEDAVERKQREARGETRQGNGQRAEGRPEIVQRRAPAAPPLVEVAEEHRRPVLAGVGGL